MHLADRFAFVQGRYGSSSEGAIESPEMAPTASGSTELKFTYWKVAVNPILDVSASVPFGVCYSVTLDMFARSEHPSGELLGFHNGRRQPGVGAQDHRPTANARPFQGIYTVA